VLNLTKRLYYKVTITTKYPNVFGTFFKAFSKKFNHIDNTFFLEKLYVGKNGFFKIFFSCHPIYNYT
jgi:hypothetical protein